MNPSAASTVFAKSTRMTADEFGFAGGTMSSNAAGCDTSTLVEHRVQESKRAAGRLIGVSDHTGQKRGRETGAAFLELAVTDAVREGLGEADEHAALCVSVHRDVRHDAQRHGSEEVLVAEGECRRHDARLVEGLEVGVAGAAAGACVEAQRSRPVWWPSRSSSQRRGRTGAAWRWTSRLGRRWLPALTSSVVPPTAVTNGLVGG